MMLHCVVSYVICVDDQVVLEVQGKQVRLEVLAVLEFNSDRKRMSVLCRLPDGRSAPLLPCQPYFQADAVSVWHTTIHLQCNAEHSASAAQHSTAHHSTAQHSAAPIESFLTL